MLRLLRDLVKKNSFAPDQARSLLHRRHCGDAAPSSSSFRRRPLLVRRDALSLPAQWRKLDLIAEAARKVWGCKV
jgi:hypothetical protein